MSDFAPGAIFAGHRIEAVAGRGGMGVVYRAVQLDLDRPVALKLIATQFAQDEGFRERFERESRAAASIDHPNVIPVYYTGEADEQLYIAMRFVEGDDLRTVTRAERLLEPGRAAEIVAQVGAALDAAHARGIVHRDVKPANVLLGPGDHVYLTDFGLTKHLHSASASTRPGGWVGTLGYVSPEQIRGQPVDARADVYALGCVLFHALTGSTPYPRDSDEATLYAHLHEPPPPVTSLAPGVPAAFEEVIARALAKDPADRFPSAGDLGRAALAAAGRAPERAPERLVARGAAAPADAPTVASPSLAPTTPALRGRHRSTRARGALLLAAILAAGGAAAGALALIGSGDGGNARRDATTTTPRPIARVTPIGLDRSATDAAYAGGRVWTTSFRSASLLGIDAGASRRTRIQLPGAVAGNSALDAGFGSLWVANRIAQTLTRVDLRTRRASPPIALPPGQAIVVAAGEGGVWVGSRTGTRNPFTIFNVVRYNPRTGTVDKQLNVPNGVQHLAVGFGSVWVLNRTKRVLTRIEIRTGDRRNVTVGHDPQRVAVGAGYVWVSNGADGTVTRIRPSSLRHADVAVGRQPVGIGVGPGVVFVANRGDSTVTRIDPRSLRVVGRPLEVGTNPTSVTVHGHRAWVTTPGDDGLTRIDF